MAGGEKKKHSPAAQEICQRKGVSSGNVPSPTSTPKEANPGEDEAVSEILKKSGEQADLGLSAPNGAFEVIDGRVADRSP